MMRSYSSCVIVASRAFMFSRSMFPLSDFAEANSLSSDVPPFARVSSLSRASSSAAARSSARSVRRARSAAEVFDSSSS